MTKSPMKSYQLYTILFIVFVGFIGASIAYPVFPPLFLHSENNIIISNAWVSSHRGLLLGITLAVYPLGQFIGSPIIGALSDKYGRKKILLNMLFGTMIGYALSAWALYAGSLWLLIFSRFVTGLAESNLAVAQSIIVDLNINKHKGFGGVNTAASIGYVVGPLLGGFLSETNYVYWFSPAIPFCIASLLSALTIYFAYQAFPEMKARQNDSFQSIWKQFDIVGHLYELIQHESIKFLLLSSLIFTIGVDLFYEFGPVYLTGQWLMTASQIALYNLLLSFAIALSGGWLPHRLATYFSPRPIVSISILAFTILLSCIIISSSVSMLVILFFLIGLVIPLPSTAISVQLSDNVNDDTQGKLMGMQWGLRMLGDAIICLLGGFLISFSVSLPLIIGVFAGLAALTIYFFRIEPQTINGFESQKGMVNEE